MLRPQAGFTLTELIMVIVIIGLLGVSVAVRWPRGMQQEAAALEFIRVARFAQHTAMTRRFATPAMAWGLNVQANRYTIQRADGSEKAEVPGNDDPTGSRRYALIKQAPMTAGAVYFNGYGEPIDTATGNPLAASITFQVGSDSLPITICPETGYARRGPACP